MKRLLALVAAYVLSLAATAGPYPDKPVRIVVPYSPGGGGDVVGRPLAVELGKQLGGAFFIENKGGAGGNIGMEYVAHAPADGYTLVLALTSQLAINQALYPSLPYDALKDFVPIALVGSAPYFLAINSSVPVKSLAEFIKLAKEKPGQLSYASTGNGSGLHLSMELLRSMTGIDIVHIPYKGGGAALTDLLTGNVATMFVSYGTGSAQIKAGKIRALAVSSKQRSPALPNVPTIAEAGVPGYDSGVWYALLAPRGTPPEIIKRLHEAAVAALRSKELGERFAADGVKPIGSTPQELTDYILSERAKWAEVVKRSGATVQ